MKQYCNPPGRLSGAPRALRRAWVRLVLFVLFRGLRAIASKVPSAREELARWKEGFVVSIGFLGSGLELILQKNGDTFYRLWKCPTPDLNICFKSVESALDVMTFRKSLALCYAENRLMVRGEIARAMEVVRLLEQVENYLLPAFIKGRLFSPCPAKEVPAVKVLWAMATDFEFFPRRERPRLWRR